jgi:hypothetical protein
VITPAFLAAWRIAAPEAASRSTIIRALTPDDSICCAIVFIFAAEAPAFWMSQFKFAFLQAARRAVGSAVTQRGEEVVSGRMMPTFAPLPSMVPPAADEGEEALPPAG